jgi:hypothetical protein
MSASIRPASNAGIVEIAALLVAFDVAAGG